MDNNTFFSKKNKDLLYNICRDELIKQTEYNIDDNKKYYRTFGEIMKIVHKHAQNKEDLTQLNKAVLGKTIPYLKSIIKKKNLTNTPLLPKNALRQPNNRQSEDLIKRTVPNTKMSMRGETTNKNYDKVKNNYESLMTERNNFYNNQKDNNKSVDKSKSLLEDLPVKPIENLEAVNEDNYSENLEAVNEDNYSDYKLEPSSLSNLNTYDSNNDEVDPMELYKQYNNERELQDTEYVKIQKDKEQFEESNKGNNQFIDNMLEETNKKSYEKENKFQDNLSMEINDQMSRANLGELKGQLDNQIDFYTQNKKEINIPTANDLGGVQSNNIYENNALFEEFKKSLFEKRKYINRENLITINSGDRDWFNGSETRFNFQVKFNPSVTGNTLVPKKDAFGKVVRVKQKPAGAVTAATQYSGDIVYENTSSNSIFQGSTNASLPKEYKNVVSFEMIRALFAVENIILPFDNRIFIDFKSLPYLVLKIDEIEGVYSGTNSRLDKAFAHLLWDKDNSSEVSTILAKFSRQFKRGFCLMAPLGFEKKTFYPSPLSSLNRLTLNVMTPKGININNHPDVLKIERINLVETIKTAKTLDEDSIVTSASSGKTSFTILEAGLKGTFTHIGQAQTISITSDNDESSINFTITGTDISGTSISETLTGPNRGAVSSVNFYSTVTAIICNSNTIGNVNAGNTADIYSKIELPESKGFPYNASKLCIQIIVFSYFSNRVFKIGDNIKIKGFEDESSDTYDINSFINRDEGHYIINLDEEVTTKENAAANEGYINTLYISPPGDLDLTKETETSILINTTGHTSEKTLYNYNVPPVPPTTTKDCKLINQSLQSNYVFKVITREDDITNVLNASNI